MDTYASQSLDTVNTWFSGANKNFFPARCNPFGFTDVDGYCATSTEVVCCGLCVNQSVAGLGQFTWACLTYLLTAIGWNLAPDAVWGVGIMQILSANAFIGSGWLRVELGAQTGGMSRYHTQFLFPQALGCIAIMGATVFAPQWMRLGRSEVSIEQELLHAKGAAATRSDVREKEKTILKRSHRRWSYLVLLIWFINLTFWTVLFLLSFTDINFSQANCESEINPSFSPVVGAIVLGIVAWLLFFCDCFVVWQETGLSDWLIDHIVGEPDMLAIEHRRLERRITQFVTGFLYLLWFTINLLIYKNGLDSFLLSGADMWSFGQVEQMTALFIDLLGFSMALGAYLQNRDELERARIQTDNNRILWDKPSLDVDIDRSSLHLSEKSLWPKLDQGDFATNNQRSPSSRQSRIAREQDEISSTRTRRNSKSSLA
ncbi:uncharacterized protein JCM6883_000911 [Sporobolomyces salmoneus]|uniref:uncharacterized protein n=1 Tax=Sporobolomyces salmoneus TaxID=183962 RepID=UPI0031717CA2